MLLVLDLEVKYSTVLPRYNGKNFGILKSLLGADGCCVYIFLSLFTVLFVECAFSYFVFRAC